MTRVVTLITVSTHAGMDDPEPLSAKAMVTAHSVGQQVGVEPDQWDLTVARDVGDFDLTTLHRMTAEIAKTEWVAFIPEGEEVKPGALANAISRASMTTADAVSADGLLLWRRDYYLSGGQS